MGQVELAPATEDDAQTLDRLIAEANDYQATLIEERIERVYTPETSAFDYVHPEIETSLDDSTLNKFNQQLTKRFGKSLNKTLEAATSKASEEIKTAATRNYIQLYNPTVMPDTVTVSPFDSDTQIEFDVLTPLTTEQIESEQWHINVPLTEEKDLALAHKLGFDTDSSVTEELSEEEAALVERTKETSPWDDAWVSFFNEVIYKNASYTGLDDLLLCIDNSWSNATVKFKSEVYTQAAEEVLKTLDHLDVEADGRGLHVNGGTTISTMGEWKRRELFHKLIYEGEITPNDARAIGMMKEVQQEPVREHVLNQLQPGWLRVDRLRTLSDKGLNVRKSWVPKRHKESVAATKETETSAQELLQQFSSAQQPYMTTVYESEVNGSEMTLVGGVHRGEKTVETVSSIINQKEPDTVAVELGPWRYLCFRLVPNNIRRASEMGVAMNAASETEDMDTTPIDLPETSLTTHGFTLDSFRDTLRWIQFSLYHFFYAYVRMLIDSTLSKLGVREYEPMTRSDDEQAIAMTTLGVTNTNDKTLLNIVNDRRNEYMRQQLEKLSKENESVVAVVGFSHLQDLRNMLASPSDWNGYTLEHVLDEESD